MRALHFLVTDWISCLSNGQITVWKSVCLDQVSVCLSAHIRRATHTPQSPHPSIGKERWRSMLMQMKGRYREALHSDCVSATALTLAELFVQPAAAVERAAVAAALLTPGKWKWTAPPPRFLASAVEDVLQRQRGLQSQAGAPDDPKKG